MTGIPNGVHVCVEPASDILYHNEIGRIWMECGQVSPSDAKVELARDDSDDFIV